MDIFPRLKIKLIPKLINYIRKSISLHLRTTKIMFQQTELDYNMLPGCIQQIETEAKDIQTATQSGSTDNQVPFETPQDSDNSSSFLPTTTQSNSS